MTHPAHVSGRRQFVRGLITDIISALLIAGVLHGVFTVMFSPSKKG